MAQETIMSHVLALLVFFGGGALILAFGATCYVALSRWRQRPLRLRRKAVEEMDALAGRVGELESETAQLPTLIERVEFLERLLEDTARAPALPGTAEPERQTMEDGHRRER